jgi:hypothetical protein
VLNTDNREEIHHCHRTGELSAVWKKKGEKKMKGRILRKKTILTSSCMLFILFGLATSGAPSRAANVSSVDPTNSSPNLAVTYLSVPADAFHPREKDYEFVNGGNSLFHLNDPHSDTGDYYAALYLPNGATLTQLSFFFSDYWAENSAGLTLLRSYHLSDSPEALAATLTSTDSPNGSATTSSFFYPIVDNPNYVYYLRFSIPDSPDPYNKNVSLNGVTIQYIPPGYGSGNDYLSIPAAGFTPYSDDLSYINQGNWVWYNGGSGGADFQAPVFLPDGATAIDATFYYYDTDTINNAQASLRRTDLAQAWEPAMADFTPTGNPGLSFYNNSITNFASINNNANGYWTFFRFPASPNVYGKSLVVHYSYGSGSSGVEAISIPAAAFTPVTKYQDYDNHGRYLIHIGGTTNQYVAPVYVPHGAYLRRMTFYYNQFGSHYAEVQLFGIDHGSSGGVPAINYIDTIGYGFRSDSVTLYNYQVDNIHENLGLSFTVPADSAWPCGVVIEFSKYKSLVFLPVVQKK